MYKEFKNLNLPNIDQEMLAFWEREKIFEKSVEQRPLDNTFVFYEGPPSANGKPGIHHVMARAIKDLVCRYHTLKGKRVERKGGWDTHGLPIELSVEKELGITKEDIGTDKISVDGYNQKCKETVMRYKNEWDDITRKMGYWVDLDNPYITYENEYIESVWWLLKQLYNKNLLYKGYTIQPYSPGAGTGLSSHELNMPGAYKEVSDTTAVALFKVVENEKSAFLFEGENEDVRIAAWTTTPWTLPSNTALTAGPKVDYVKVKTLNPYTNEPISVVLAEALVGKWFGGKNQPEIIEQSSNMKGAELDGIRYEQLFDFGNEIEPLLGNDGEFHTDAFRVVLGDFVTTEDGTGVVHTAPSFGADDMKAAKTNGIGALTLVDKQGKFKSTVGEFSDKYVKNYKDEEEYRPVDVDIVIKLKTDNKALNVAKYNHNYPHCWRTDKPVLYYPLDSWFIKASACKERMYELNKTINWKPASTGEGRFGKWLENLQDWNLSRSRYWGIPLPIWRTADGEQEKCIGSVADLQSEIEKANAALGLNQEVPKDLHRPYIDDVILVADDGQEMKRELDLIDVWFDSGSMPYAQWHYPFSLPPTPSKGGGGRPQPRYMTANPMSYELLKEYAKRMRDNPTDAEKVLWNNLRGKKLEGYKFRQQHIIGDYIADFLCLKKNLIVEVDGQIHEKPEVKKTDAQRTAWLSEQGYHVLRIKNEEIFHQPEIVLTKIKDKLDSLPNVPKSEVEKPSPLGEGWEGQFPADFIAEGVDQTRGWFYTLHAIATMVFDSVAFKNVVSNGLVLDKNGNKMSKRLNNAVDPFETIAKYGADATRWYMISNSQPWDNLKFDLEGIGETQRKFFGTLYNTYSFFALYANIDNWQMDESDVLPMDQRSELDRWIISKLYSLVDEYRTAMDDYEPTRACRAIEEFVDSHLSNWYVRLSRRRFWKGEMSTDKRAAYETLFECLMVTGQLSTCVAPFFSDWLYKNLTDPIREKAVANNTPLRHESVHLTDLVERDATKVDKALEQRMEYAQRISSLILSLRKKENIRVRQPLQKVMLPILDEAFIKHVEGVKDLVMAETNIKEIEYITDTAGVIKKKIKPNFKTLGKRLGKNMKAAAQAVAGFSQDDISNLEKTGAYILDVDGEKYELTLEDFEITAEDVPGLLVATDGPLTVALDVTLNDDLIAEGTARELVNRIQNIRKGSDFNVTDKINIQIEKHEAVYDAVANYSDYIKQETLALALDLVDNAGGERVELFDDVSLFIKVEKA
ncbi:MAG: isoleucine--tRNA ligase [Saprospiraceae bacterium]